MTKEVRLEIFNYLFLIHMKLKDNALSLIKQILDNPKNDWSNDLPIIELTEKDFAFAQSIIKRRISDTSRKKKALEWLDQFQEEYKRHVRSHSPHLDFYISLRDHLTFKKRWHNKQNIDIELQKQFPYIGEWGHSDELYDKVHGMICTLTTAREFEKRFYDKVAELKELNLEEEFSKLKEIGLEIGEGN